MKILSNFTPYPINYLSNPINNFKTNASFSHISDAFVTTQPSFGSSKSSSNTSKGDFLRTLNNVRDPYSGVIILTHNALNKAVKKISNQHDIRGKLDVLSKYENSMLPVEKQVYQMFKAEAKKDKNTTFSEILQSKQYIAARSLVKEQNAIFDKIQKETYKMNTDYQDKIFEQLAEARKRIEILPTNNEKHKFKRKTFITKIMAVRENDILDQVTVKILNSNIKNKSQEIKKCNEIREYVNTKPFDTNINGKIPLDHVLELQKKYIPETLEDNNDYWKIIYLAMQLPTSENNINAFILKYADRSNKEIAERLLNQSVGTVEHIVPNSLGGPNEAYNFMWASKSRNEERGNMSFDRFKKKHPDLDKHLQEYTDDIIKKGNNGYLDQYEWYPYVFREHISKHVGIDLDISKYEIKPEEAFKTCPAYYKSRFPQFAEYISNSDSIDITV